MTCNSYSSTLETSQFLSGQNSFVKNANFSSFLRDPKVQTTGFFRFAVFVVIGGIVDFVVSRHCGLCGYCGSNTLFLFADVVRSADVDRLTIEKSEESGGVAREYKWHLLIQFIKWKEFQIITDMNKLIVFIWIVCLVDVFCHALHEEEKIDAIITRVRLIFKVRKTVLELEKFSE